MAKEKPEVTLSDVEVGDAATSHSLTIYSKDLEFIRNLHKQFEELLKVLAA